MRSASYVDVLLDIPPHRGRLLQWGRAQDGQWWALITWQEVILGERNVDRDYLQMSAWTRAAHVTPRRADSSTSALPRIALGADPASWAGPDG